MIFTVGGIKGGTGKTTIATNLAVWLTQKGNDVLLIDADDQQTSMNFYRWRIQTLGAENSNIGITTVELTGEAIRTSIATFRTKFDHIVIDTGGRDTISQRSAIVASDVYLLPFQPRSLDGWTVNDVNKLIEEIVAVKPSKLTSIGFLNRADVRGDDNRDFIEMMQDYPNIHFLQEKLTNRKAFSSAAANGLSVIEIQPNDSKATKELNDLFTAITNWVIEQTKK